MTEVILSDGTIAEFPDGMSRDQMRDAIMKRYSASGNNAPSERSAMDQITGRGGERHQLWPERAVREIGRAGRDFVSMFGEGMRGELPVVDPATGRTSDAVIGRAFEGAALMSPAGPGARALGGAVKASRKAMSLGDRLKAQQSAKALGVEVPRPVTGTLGQSMSGRALQDIPFVGAPLEQAGARALGQLDDAARAASQRYGSGDVAGAGEAVKSAIRETATQHIPDIIGRRYEEVGRLVSDDVFMPLSATKTKAGQILSERKNAALKGSGNAVGLVAEAISRDAGMNFSGLKTLRTAVGEIMDDPAQLAASGMSKTELKRVYGALTDDLESIVSKAGGEDAMAAFRTANTYAKIGSQFRDEMQRVIGKGVEKSDENVIAFIQRIAGSNASANIKTLRKVRNAASDSWDEVASAIAGRLGRDQRGDFSATRFVSDYDKLSPSGKNALFNATGNGELRTALDDIATVSKAFDKYNQSKNYSNTGKAVAALAGVGGLAAAPVTTLSAAFGARMTAQYLSKPQTAKAVAKWAKAYERAARNPTDANVGMLRNRSKLLLEAGGVKGGGAEGTRLVEQLSGGAVKGVADSETDYVPDRNPVPGSAPNQSLMESYRERPFGPGDA